MHRIRRTQVESMTRERLSLDRSFHLTWQWLKYSGLHQDLLPISAKQSRTSDIVRWLFTLLVLLLLLTLGLTQLSQLVIEIWSVEKMVDAVPNFMFTDPYILLMFCQYELWSHRRHIKQLFNDWKEIEQQTNCFNTSEAKREVRATFTRAFIVSILHGISNSVWNLMEPEKSYFFTCHLAVRETFGVPLISAVTGFASSYYIFFFSTFFIIPTLFFCHVACAVENMVKEWNSSQKNEQHLRVIWQRYESILYLVDRANNLFGISIVVHDAYFAFTTCLMIFFALEQFQKSIVAFLVTTIFIIYTILHTVIFNRSLSRLYFSSTKLSKLIADHLSRNWYTFHEEDRQLLVCFLTRLNTSDISVHPMKLYFVNPTNLLGLSALVINYFIVLAQAN